ncbi:hypothetical protein [Ramlibacter alkalitolerans]|uniref:Uncharacterized protein n=1 Tax=Ramlibacter alkalitolerans TaxID=2039631 RepID=A0ABS1JV54_9BURK|nr:hypothetical protein [Ramlibacter alkalitolerans]MBL0427756.1 hypothetical protein [Ramlibacter alkalitolerans]
MKLLKHNAISKFEAGASAGLLAVLLAVNAVAVGYLANGVRDVIMLKKQTAVLPESLAAAKSFAVEAAPVSPAELAVVAQTLRASYSGLDISVTKDSKLRVAAKNLEDFEIFRQSIYAVVPQLQGVRWKASEMCLGPCPATAAHQGKVQSVAEAASSQGALTITLNAERLGVAGAAPAAAPAPETPAGAAAQ